MRYRYPKVLGIDIDPALLPVQVLCFAFNSSNVYRSMHDTPDNCLIPTCKNTCGRNNTKTFLEIFFIGYHFITARKVSSAISSLNVCENVTGYIDISLPERPEV